MYWALSTLLSCYSENVTSRFSIILKLLKKILLFLFSAKTAAEKSSNFSNVFLYRRISVSREILRFR